MRSSPLFFCVLKTILTEDNHTVRAAPRSTLVLLEPWVVRFLTAQKTGDIRWRKTLEWVGRAGAGAGRGTGWLGPFLWSHASFADHNMSWRSKGRRRALFEEMMAVVNQKATRATYAGDIQGSPVASRGGWGGGFSLMGIISVGNLLAGPPGSRRFSLLPASRLLTETGWDEVNSGTTALMCGGHIKCWPFSFFLRRW